LQAGLPPHSDGARAPIVDERVRRAGLSVARIERNLRYLEQLRLGSMSSLRRRASVCLA